MTNGFISAKGYSVVSVCPYCPSSQQEVKVEHPSEAKGEEYPEMENFIPYNPLGNVMFVWFAGKLCF